ncbi:MULTISPECIES: lipid IV(A) 3-deoxy-D-manno-octulosonic acid transferase [unclassified Vibrio]|uniref:lipid IV(A) 3-deoxy-D-manno-octulosonic acid transferase n=1 Tax=unclassified Vibrio TaxID=2614977 RepID=UPI001482CA01|nr:MULTISPECIES: lipid IV(A) 3-deoxy-D-manno-octulosonic acid transferase [unclassified Vibrio]NNN76219.1 3-deoxy-D-manno-octulosonic acid transferase [Vibrio sp. B7]NNN92810.1 3-deoxy-D-manno-octulosonic acid transferase [Vibrio sp. B8-1]NNO08339.1 3-deoxy-D-manno-octulosonic acid transferase [Vibrio sp. B4-12]MDQ2192049.1 3-deoxy-D-manno-octulosonic acid transferase [Vibrio sp. A14(2019)]MDQ2197076.1 3-deoxy-D-manno-octulosonic acid transferase [Vibrio sp. 2017_1457_11]
MLIRWLYTFLLTIVSPFLMWSLYRKRDGKPSVGARWKEHFGFTPPLETNKSPIWIHAVSVGETLSVSPLIKKLKSQYPDQPIVITTTTPTGAEQAAKLQGIAEHRYMPFDFSFAIRGFLNAIKPSQLLIMETELWPNTLHTVARSGIPITVINARLSERSCQRYAKVQPIFNMLAKNLTRVLCQYPDDAQRFIRLGVTKEKIFVTGSIKFDIDIDQTTIQKGQQLRSNLGRNRPIWIAASTHQGEDEQVLAAHAEVLKEHPNALLILVPRHPERFNAVFELCKTQFISVRRTETESELDPEVQVYLGDTMGEMLVLMGAADICFMGGSLLGDKVGGHNMLEPAALGKPVLTGPSYYNFTDITEQLIKAEGLEVVTTAKAISKSISQAFNDKNVLHSKSQSTRLVIDKNRGSLANTILAIELII